MLSRSRVHGVCGVLGVVLLVLPLAVSGRPKAPDPTAFGPHGVLSAEYQFPATVDPDILSDRATEIWARVYWPDNIDQTDWFPLVVFLHGNHGTCGTGTNPRVDDRIDYTTTGTCPPGYVVTPNHLGYGYLADRLASHGYIVVSINANRGITAGAGIVGDAGLNLARGRLILRHLELLKSWHDNLGTTPTSLGIDLFGKLDFTNVGLMGHSRGGEGVRAAYNLYHDPDSIWPPRIPGLVVKGIFEIGAVDGQTSRVLNAEGTKWNQLLPACDGDVSNLQGVRPYDRMLTSADVEHPPTQKSYFMVWGANHNFYNTEWQVSDSMGCFNHVPLFPTYVGSAGQRLTALVPLVAFFRANVGMSPPTDPEPVFNQIFNPWYRLPKVITRVTRVDREFVHSPDSSITLAFEYFDKPTGVNTYDVPNETSNLFMYIHTTNPARHAPSRRMAAISWRDPGINVYFQTNWTAVGSGVDVRGYTALDFSIALRSLPEAPLDFSLRLVHDDGTMSSRVNFASYHQNPLNTIAGGPGGLHTLLFTTRIPLKDFTHAKLRHVRGIRFTFDDTPRVDIYLGNIRLSTKLKTPDGVNDPPSPSFDAEDVAEAREEKPAWYPVDRANTASGPAVHNAMLARYAASNSRNSNNNLIEGVVTYASPNVFAPQAELFQLEANGEPISKFSAHSNDLREISFTVSAADYQKLLATSDLQISRGNERWIIPTGP